jgi:hypothetical protein
MRRPDRDDRVLALVAGIAALAGPRRTRPLAGFLYGVALSRVHAAHHHRVEDAIVDLFSQRKALTPRVDTLDAHVDEHGEHLDELERRLGYVERLKARVQDLEIVNLHPVPEEARPVHQRVVNRALDHLTRVQPMRHETEDVRKIDGQRP